MVRYQTLAEDPGSELVWISEAHGLPDVCCTCGMFTADRIKVKHTATIDPKFKKKNTAWNFAHLLLYLFGGPIGWILGMALDDDDDGKPKSKTVKVAIPQCVLCRSEVSVEISDSNYDEGEYQFWVHPLFATRYQIYLEDKLKAEKQMAM